MIGGVAAIVLLGPGPDNNAGARQGHLEVSAQGVTVNLTRPRWGTIIEPGQPPSLPAPFSDVQIGLILGALGPPPAVRQPINVPSDAAATNELSGRLGGVTDGRLSTSTVSKLLKQRGLRPIGAVQLKDGLYRVTAIDAEGRTVELVIDPEGGSIKLVADSDSAAGQDGGAAINQLSVGAATNAANQDLAKAVSLVEILPPPPAFPVDPGEFSDPTADIVPTAFGALAQLQGSGSYQRTGIALDIGGKYNFLMNIDFDSRILGTVNLNINSTALVPLGGPLNFSMGAHLFKDMVGASSSLAFDEFVRKNFVGSPLCCAGNTFSARLKVALIGANAGTAIQQLEIKNNTLNIEAKTAKDALLIQVPFQ